jgi:hypothetical protein
VDLRRVSKQNRAGQKALYMPVLTGRRLVSMLAVGLAPSLQLQDLSRIPSEQTKRWIRLQLPLDSRKMLKSLFPAVIL